MTAGGPGEREDAVRQFDWDARARSLNTNYQRRMRKKFRDVDPEWSLPEDQIVEGWQLAKMWESAGGECQYCSRPLPLHRVNMWNFDHCIPVVSFGANTVENLVLCCAWCNSQKANRQAPDFLMIDRYTGEKLSTSNVEVRSRGALIDKSRKLSGRPCRPVEQSTFRTIEEHHDDNNWKMRMSGHQVPRNYNPPRSLPAHAGDHEPEITDYGPPVIPDGYRHCPDCARILPFTEEYWRPYTASVRKRCPNATLFPTRCDACQRKWWRDDQRRRKTAKRNAAPNAKERNEKLFRRLERRDLEKIGKQRCSRCYQVKDLNVYNFRKQRQTMNGFRTICIECDNARDRERYKRPERKRQIAIARKRSRSRAIASDPTYLERERKRKLRERRQRYARDPEYRASRYKMVRWWKRRKRAEVRRELSDALPAQFRASFARQILDDYRHGRRGIAWGLGYG